MYTYQIPYDNETHEKVEVPIGVIVGSVIAGILLLLALVAILWKVRTVSYFKIWGPKDLCLPISYHQSNPTFSIVRQKEMQVCLQILTHVFKTIQ